MYGGWGGVAYVGFPGTALRWAGDYWSGGATALKRDKANWAHEVGHNLGCYHDSFGSIEYGSPFSVMGHAPIPEGHFYGAGKAIFEWMEKGEIRRGAKRQADNAISSCKNRTNPFFRKRCAFTVTSAVIVTLYPNPFRDSLRLSQPKKDPRSPTVGPTTRAVLTTSIARPSKLAKKSKSSFNPLTMAISTVTRLLPSSGSPPGGPTTSTSSSGGTNTLTM